MSSTKTWDEWVQQYTVLVRAKNPNASDEDVDRKAKELAEKKVTKPQNAGGDNV